MPVVLILNLVVLLLSKFFIKIVITVFGWATGIFFGKFSKKWRVAFYIMMILSFVWVFFVIAKVFPVLFDVFKGYVPEMTFMEVIINVVSVLAIMAIPPAVSFIGAKIKGINIREKKRIAFWLVKCYAYTVVLGVSMAVMLVCSPVIRVLRIIRHIKADNMAMGIAGVGNIYVMDEIIKSLEKEGMVCSKKIPPKIYSLPSKMLKGIVKDLFGYTADREFYIKGDNLSIYLNPSDIMIEGFEGNVEAVKKAIVKGFVANDIYLTESESSRSIENDIHYVYEKLQRCDKDIIDVANAMADVKKLLNSDFFKIISYEDWALLSAQIGVIEGMIIEKSKNLKQIE